MDDGWMTDAMMVDYADASDDPEKPAVVTLSLPGKGKGTLIEKTQYDMELGVYHRWAKMNHLTTGRDNHPNAHTLTLTIEVRADQVEYFGEGEDEMTPLSFASGLQGSSATPQMSMARVSSIVPRRYVSSLPVPLTAVRPPFGQGDPPIFVYESLATWNPDRTAIEWSDSTEYAYLWIDNKILGQGQTRNCYEVKLLLNQPCTL